MTKSLKRSFHFQVMAACVSVTLAMAACGGGSDAPTATPITTVAPPATPVTTDKTTVKATVDADPVATPNRQLVTRVHSLFGDVAVGGNVPVTRLSPSAPTLLVGVDVQGSERLLRYEEGESALSADTTAYALVRMALKLADRPTDSSQDGLLGYIRKSNAYPGALQAVRTSLSTSTAGGTLAAADVSDKIALVVQDVLKQASQPFVKDSSPKLLQAAIASAPYFFFNVGNTERVWLDDPLSFKNRTFLYWHLSAKADAGTWETTAPPLKSTLLQLAGDYAGSESITAVKAPADKFTLTLDQNKESQLLNAQAAVTRSLFALIEVLLGAVDADSSRLEKCTIAVSKTVLSGPLFAPLVANFSSSAIGDFVFDNTLDIVKTIASDCTNGDAYDAGTKSVLKELTNEAVGKTIGRVYKALKAAKTAASAYGTLTQFATYDKYSKSVDVCSKDGKIVECAAEASVRITSATCTKGSFTSRDGFIFDLLREEIVGTASGPVGALFFPYPNESLSYFYFNEKTGTSCGNWSVQLNNGSGINSTCKRTASDPPTTTFIHNLRFDQRDYDSNTIRQQFTATIGIVEKIGNGVSELAKSVVLVTCSR